MHVLALAAVVVVGLALLIGFVAWFAKRCDREEDAVRADARWFHRDDYEDY